MTNKFHFSAGFELKSVRDKLVKSLSKDDLAKYEGLRRSLSSFIVKSDCDLDTIPADRDNKFAFVLHNMIMRGIPTLASFDLEDEIRREVGAINFRESNTKSLEHSLSDEIPVSILLAAMHIVEPRIDRNTAYENYLTSWEDHGSEFEERYLYKELPERTFNGEGDFLIQLIQPQRSISSIIPEGREDNIQGGKANEQRVDFAFEFPYTISINKRKGVCIEIDGSQHEENIQKRLDKWRDDALLESDWMNTIRLKTNQFTEYELKSHFNRLTSNEQMGDLFDAYLKNYKSPLYQSIEGMRALELILSPFAVARIQFVLIKAIISGYLSLEEEKWKIAVLERDVPCARLAIDDLKRFLKAIAQLENKGREFPEVELSVYYTSEYEHSSLRNINDLPVVEIEENKTSFDIFIDISILERDGLSKRHEAVIYDTFLQIRSAYHFPIKTQPFLTSNRITWGNLVVSKDNDNWEGIPESSKGLEFFIQNIFRKKTFREGQLRILDRALRNQTVIGLLPTGGGKSLTYQLAGILQPGHVIVIDPIKSLMKDQVDSLAKIGITGTVFINSSLKDFEARNKAQKKLSNGHALFCFISPERLMIERFRYSLGSMADEKHFFSYGVIDEVHCVSEWGHNFRTPYLSLGRNLLDFCKAADGKIALFGLTATASFDVLSDVQRELSGNRESQTIPDEAIIRHENTNRDELQYYVEKVDLGLDRILELQAKAKGAYFGLKLNEQFGLLKQKRINEILLNPGPIIRKFNSNPQEVINEDLILLTYPVGSKINAEEVHQKLKIPKEAYEGDFWNFLDSEGNNNAALVFAPHKTWYFGVTDKYRSDGRGLGITDSIIRANLLPIEKVGTFMGVDSDDETLAQTLQADNDKNQEAFVGGFQQLMVATKAFGMGIDKPNIRLTIHNNFPDSIESFVQEAGRGGRDRRLSVACILYNDQEVEDPMKDKVYRHDFDLQESFFWNSFKGEDHEKWILYELLNEIIFPGRDRVKQLTRILKEHPDIMDLGVDVWVSHYQPSNRLYVNFGNKQNFGYVEYLTGKFVTQLTNVEKNKSITALNSLWSIVRDLAVDISPEFMQSWLNETHESEKKPGIEKVLESMDYGRDFEIEIPFSNDHLDIYQRLSALLLELMQIENTPSMIKEYSNYCKNNYHVKLDQFLEKLDAKIVILQKVAVLELENPELVSNTKSKIQSLLNKRRDKQDTEKAIFRFSVIGLIDDYTVDYNSETYILKGRKKIPEEYHESLRFYISKYYSQKRADNIISSLSERKGNTEVQRILNFITDFVYKEIAKKRHEGISFMQDCCKIGLERGNVEMKSWIHLYFNSKYARKGYSVKIEDNDIHHFSHLPFMDLSEGEYNASLLDWTDEGQEENFEFVLDFMHLMEFDDSNSERDNLKHLRGACTRLVIANPDNYVFRLLRAFAILILEEGNLKQNLKNSILDDLMKGYINLFEREGDEFDMDDAMVHYKAAMIDKLQNKSAQEWFLDVLGDLEFLAHVEWTTKFKEKFTKDLIL